MVIILSFKELVCCGFCHVVYCFVTLDTAMGGNPVEFHGRIYKSQAVDQINDLFEDTVAWSYEHLNILY